MATFEDVQHCVVVELTASDHTPRWTISELVEALPEFEPELVRTAVAQLWHCGALYMGGDDEAWATPGVRCIGKLGLIFD